MADSNDNAAERRRWNDEYWISVWPRREQLTRAVTDLLLEHLSLRFGPGTNPNPQFPAVAVLSPGFTPYVGVDWTY